MRFTFATISLVAAIAFTSAAVVPRANLKPAGIESRYFRGEVYQRAVPEAPEVVARSEPELRTRRIHAREFRMPSA
ncbi:hypothetical protein B0H34DRAFT_730897 [Crassisporium funariophilum]|nr:hypothetical protein B0H34DRAFT_730897 [Crassisporium funariophilum]